MGLIARDTSGGDFEPIPEAMHHGICYGLYDLGTQYNERFGKAIHKCLIVWELPNERITVEKDGEQQDLPKSISKQYTLSLHEKSNLRKDLETWRGRQFTEKELEGFDLSKLLNANCTLQIIHKKKDGKTYANIAAVLPMMPKEPKREPENALRFYSFEDGGQMPPNTPNWIVDIIKASEEYNDGGQWESGQEDEQGIPLDAYNDDMPF